jgi:membrane protease YdiL (CAAX protease family)
MDGAKSIRNVNLLYLLAFLGLIVGSILFPMVSLGWRVVMNELFFLGLPLAAFLLLTGADVKEALRLRGVPWEVALLSGVTGLGLWRFDWWLATSLNQLLDYTIPLPPEVLNLTPVDQALMVTGLVVLAPVIEELFFRGVLQRAYERLGPVPAIAVSSLLFMAIHQELAQSVALLPVAAALGYVTWRTNSIVPAMIIHFGNNAQALVVSAFEEGTLAQSAFAPSPLTGIVGGLAGAAALWLLARRTARPERGRRTPQRGWLARSWPLFPVAPIYLGIIALGVLIGARPELLALGNELDLTSAPWSQETRWRYEIRNAVDEVVGQAECTVTPESESFVLECAMEQSAYEAEAPTGFFQEGAVSQRQVVRWSRGTLALEDLLIEASIRGTGEPVSMTARLEDERLVVLVGGEENPEERFDLCYSLGGMDESGGGPGVQDPCSVNGAFVAGGGLFSPLMVGEWPWRLSALPFRLAFSRKLDVIWPYRGIEGLDGRAPARQDGYVVVRTADHVSTPLGDFVTWRVTVGEEYTAWYTVDAPHHLVAYSDDMVTWRLTEVE